MLFCADRLLKVIKIRATCYLLKKIRATCYLLVNILITSKFCKIIQKLIKQEFTDHWLNLVQSLSIESESVIRKEYPTISETIFDECMDNYIRKSYQNVHQFLRFFAFFEFFFESRFWSRKKAWLDLDLDLTVTS
jgi:hypothetical protein